MVGQQVGFLTLPPEIISSIFVLSSNPSLVILCRELNHTLSPQSKSLVTRIEFLLVRYRGNYVKAIIKGLRWAFFDLELLEALDRMYRKERMKLLEAISKQPMNLKSTNEDSPLSQQPSNARNSRVAASRGEPERKKRKKYYLPSPELAISDTSKTHSNDEPDKKEIQFTEASTLSIFDQEIPLPKDFQMPKGLFKSSKHIPLIRVLLSRGASPSCRSHYPLVRASQRGDTEMVRLLVEYGAPLEMTALRWACVEEKDEIIEIFLEKGVIPDGQCLSWCVEKGKTRMIDKLLSLGVVPDLKTVLSI